jgi:hypothetical protein
MANIKLREADQLIRFILTDIWQAAGGEISYEHQDGQDLYFVTLEGDERNREDGKQTLTISKITMGSGQGTENLGSYKWRGTKDAMTDAARQWVFDTIKAAQ